MMNPSLSHRLDRLGCQLHYWTAGPPTGRAVLFTHDAALDHAMFRPQLAPLVAAGYRVLMWDLRGHGQSQPMGEPLSLRTAADDLIAILDAEGIAKAVLVGQSFGGLVAQEVTLRRLDRVAGLVVNGCTSLVAKPMIRARLARHLVSLRSAKAFRTRIVERLGTNPDTTAYGYRVTAGLQKPDFLAIAQARLECLSTDLGYPHGTVIECPFLLTHGLHDQVIKPIARLARRWAKREPHCTYRIIPDAGHTASLDNADTFTRLLLNFLATLESR